MLLSLYHTHPQIQAHSLISSEIKFIYFLFRISKSSPWIFAGLFSAGSFILPAANRAGAGQNHFAAGTFAAFGGLSPALPEGGMVAFRRGNAAADPADFFVFLRLCSIVVRHILPPVDCYFDYIRKLTLGKYIKRGCALLFCAKYGILL